MPTPYNLTRIENATDIADMFLGINNLAPGYLGNSIVVSLFAISLVGMLSLNINPSVAVLSSSALTLLCSVLLFFFGMTSVWTIGLSSGILVGSAIWITVENN